MSGQQFQQFILAVGAPFADVHTAPPRVAIGPVAGLTIHGPFASAEQAEDAALNSHPDASWFVVPVIPIELDSAIHGDGYAEEESAATAALAIMVTIVDDYPGLLEEFALGEAVADDLRAALAESPGLAEYLRRAAGGAR